MNYDLPLSEIPAPARRTINQESPDRAMSPVQRGSSDPARWFENLSPSEARALVDAINRA